MKKVLLFCAFSMSVLNFAQVHFEKGYLVDSNDQKKECLIRNEDLKDNPSSFEYKLTDEGVVQTGNLYNVKSFEVYNQQKYVSANVDIDQSKENLSSLSTSSLPEYKNEKVFLRVLVDGKYKLYEYIDGNQIRYFYSDSTSDIKPLVYKIYQIDAGKIGYNEGFKRQLKDVLKCDGMNQNNFSNLDYSARNLTKAFQKTNECADPNYIVATSEHKSGKFNLYIRPRINSSSLEFQNFFSSDGFKMDNKLSFGVGAEFEYVAAINRNKWAVFFEPNFLSYKAESTFEKDYLIGGKVITNVVYKSIDLPLGIRHYFFLNNTSKIFIDAAAIPNISFGSSFEQRRANGELLTKTDVSSAINYGFGIGYNYSSKFSIEARYQTPRPILNGDATSDFRMLTLALGYNIF